MTNVFKKTVNRFGTNKCLVMSREEKQSEPRYKTYDLFASARRIVFPSPRRKRDTQPETCSLATDRALTPSHSCSRIDRNHKSLCKPAIRGENVGAGREKMKHLEDFWPVGVWTTSRDVFVGYLKSAALQGSEVCVETNLKSGANHKKNKTKTESTQR